MIEAAGPAGPALAELAAARSPAIDPELAEAFARLLAEDPSRMHRHGGPVHLTASAIVVDAHGEHVALVWHRKGGFWVQPGGHIEPQERSFELAARREVGEETGLVDLERVGPGPAMLHRHALSAAFGACREHWDVQYLLRTARPAAEMPLVTSPESPEVAWARLDHLPAGTVADLPGTILRLRPLLRALPA